jgi:peptidyl-prolyl cis-trans isomerase SurA
VPPLKEVSGRVQEAIYMQKLEPALRAYLTKLREDAYIDIKPGYVDTSASPNETKPVYTTAVSQGAPSKKKKKKLGVF